VSLTKLSLGGNTYYSGRKSLVGDISAVDEKLDNLFLIKKEKKVIEFAVSSRDVTNQTFPGRE
jgi:hypothetical protein